MPIDPAVVGTILNLVALLGVLGSPLGSGSGSFAVRSRWSKLLLPILALIFALAAIALITFPLSFSGSAESQQQIEVDR